MEGRSHFEGHICSVSPCAEGLMTETRGHGTERHNAQGLREFEVTCVTHLEGFEGQEGQDTMAEWLRRQIRI